MVVPVEKESVQQTNVNALLIKNSVVAKHASVNMF
jgi:hypothetical protein